MSDHADRTPERPAPSCQAAGHCTGPNAQLGICDCYDDIWEGEEWWEQAGESDD